MARQGRGRLAGSGFASPRHRAILVRRYRRGCSHRVEPPLRKSRARPCRARLEYDQAAARAGNDAAELAQPFYLRSIRRKGLGSHPFAVQVGPILVHAPPPLAAERASAGAHGDADPGRSDLGARICPLQEAVRGQALYGSVERHSIEPNAPTARPSRNRAGTAMSAPVIGFAGLTHLGLVSALAVASKGFRVVGYDTDASRVRDIAAGRLPVVEPGLDELARGCAQRVSFSSQVKDLGACDLVYISTDVPTDDHGQSDLSGISASIAQVIAILSPRALLVVLCQVPPGFTRALPLPSERLFYQVETLVFGRAVERATRPERYIVGCADPEKALPEAFAAVLGAFGCPI